MGNQDYGDDFIIILKITGTEYDEVEVKVEDPYRNISDLINNIIREFRQPKVDPSGAPYRYDLSREKDGEEEILLPQNEDGEECCLLDYGVQSGDELFLLKSVIAG